MVTDYSGESHTRQLQDLSLKPLFERREALCKTFAYRTATNSRHQNMFCQTKSLLRQGKHVHRYREPRARTVGYYKSALPYLTRLLNDM